MPLLPFNCPFIFIIIAAVKESSLLEILHKIFCPIAVQGCWANSSGVIALADLYQLEVSYLISNCVSLQLSGFWDNSSTWSLPFVNLWYSFFFPLFAEDRSICNLFRKFNSVKISDPMHSEGILFIGIMLYLLFTALLLEMFADHCWMQFWLESNELDWDWIAGIKCCFTAQLYFLQNVKKRRPSGEVLLEQQD